MERERDEEYMLLFLQQRCCLGGFFVSSTGFIFSGFQNETKGTLPGRLQYIHSSHTHTHRYICLYCSQRLNFGPEPCLSSGTAFSSRMKQDGYASFSPVISRLSQYLPVHSFEFSLFLTCASIDDNFSYKKHAYLMNRFYS